MSPKKENVKLLQNKLFELLIEFDKICIKCGVKYWLDGGTFLGAVRHSGFIPWDDDLDVSMHFLDFEKLLNELNTKCGKNSNRMLYFYGKQKFALSEFYANTEFLKDGAFPIRIDITPVKFVINTEEYSKIDKSFTQLAQLYTYGRCKDESLILSDHYDKYYPVNKRYSLKMSNLYNDYFSFIREQWILISKENSTNYYINYLFEDILVNKKRDHYTLDNIFPLTTIPFNGKSFPSPNSTEYLTILYGDFMKLPPAEQQVESQRSLVKSKFKSKRELESFITDMYVASLNNFALGYNNRALMKKKMKILSFAKLFSKYIFSARFNSLKCLIRYGRHQAFS